MVIIQNPNIQWKMCHCWIDRFIGTSPTNNLSAPRHTFIEKFILEIVYFLIKKNEIVCFSKYCFPV